MRVVRLAKACLILLLIIGTCILVIHLHIGGRLLFKRLVARPIPKSVHEIRVDRCQISSIVDRLDGFRERAFILRFKIDREDLARIIEGRGFQSWENAKYSKGNLRYRSSDQFITNVKLYSANRDAPSWFDLREWTEFETYFVGRDKIGLRNVDVSLLLYNEQLGSAYLIKWEMSGLR